MNIHFLKAKYSNRTFLKNLPYIKYDTQKKVQS